MDLFASDWIFIINGNGETKERKMRNAIEKIMRAAFFYSFPFFSVCELFFFFSSLFSCIAIFAHFIWLFFLSCRHFFYFLFSFSILSFFFFFALLSLLIFLSCFSRLAFSLFFLFLLSCFVLLDFLKFLTFSYFCLSGFLALLSNYAVNKWNLLLLVSVVFLLFILHFAKPPKITFRSPSPSRKALSPLRLLLEGGNQSRGFGT